MKIKIPKEISQELTKKIFLNLLRAIGIMAYFVILNLAYITMEQSRLIGDIKVFATTFLLAGLFMLEKAYKNDSGQTAITAIELLVLSMHSLSIMHIITFYKYDFRLYLLTSSYVIAIYYVLKAIFIHTRGRKEYLNSLSDISEIVKKEEPVVKEAKKRSEQEESKKVEKERVEEVKAQNKEKITKPKSIRRIQRKPKEVEETPNKKTSKKQDNIEEVKTEETEQKPKKKRGRPKKEVKEND